MGLFRNKRVFVGFAHSQRLAAVELWQGREHETREGRLSNHKIRAMIESMSASKLEISGAENRRWQETQRVPGSIAHQYEPEVLQQQSSTAATAQQQHCGNGSLKLHFL